MENIYKEIKGLWDKMSSKRTSLSNWSDGISDYYRRQSQNLIWTISPEFEKLGFEPFAYSSRKKIVNECEQVKK